MFTDLAAHVYLFGSPGSGSWAACGVYEGPLTSLQAMSIDQKMDDGLPASGQVMTFAYLFTPQNVFVFNPCVTTSMPYAYNQNTQPVCMLLFQAQF